MSNYLADVATNVFPGGYIMVKGIMSCTVVGSFSASLQLTNNHVAPVCNKARKANLWV